MFSCSTLFYLLIHFHYYPISPDQSSQVSAGNIVTLSCRYTGSNVVLYWYRQYPSSKLDNLLYILESGRIYGSPPPDFSAKVQNKIVHLEISSTAVSDSALYYCALRWGWGGGGASNTKVNFTGTLLVTFVVE
uniref:Ig-like domain-containing protein n=1 Tax=Astyanax mexicanus TaxID=7994 RepID=A0A3B1IVR6_ASTMX